MCGDEAAAVRASLDCRYPVRSSYPYLTPVIYQYICIHLNYIIA